MHIAYLVLDPGIPLGGMKGASVHVDAITGALRAVGHRVTILAAAVASDERLDGEAVLVPLGAGERRTIRSLRTLVREELPECRIDRDLKSCLTAATTTRSVAKRLHEIEADVVLERLSLFGVAGLAAAREVGVPHALEINAPIAREAERHRHLALNDLAHALEHRVIRETDFRFPVSEPIARYCEAIGAPPDFTRVIPNGVDCEQFSVRGHRSHERRDLGFSDHDCVIGLVSTLRKWHGGSDLVCAFAEAIAAAPNLRLLVIGDGPDAPAMRERLAEAGLSGMARFAGAVPHERMPALMEAMDVAVAPYRPSSDFYFSPLKLVEAMAMGLPVVASAMETISEVITDRETGRLVRGGDVNDLARALAELATDRDQRLDLGARARLVVTERYTWKKAADRISHDLEATRSRLATALVGPRAGALVSDGSPADGAGLASLLGMVPSVGRNSEDV